MDEILRLVETAFAAVPRPEHFTSYLHCDECQEHDELMRSRDRATLTVEDVADLPWTPLAFLTPEGYRYYMPALVRLALSAEGEDVLAYLVRDLGAPIPRDSPPSHLPRTALFGAEETRAVLAFLRYVRDHKQEVWERCGDSPRVLARALRNWEHFVSCRNAASPSTSV
jgi:uncharacterized protein DUF6714